MSIQNSPFQKAFLAKSGSSDPPHDAKFIFLYDSLQVKSIESDYTLCK